MTVSTDVLNPLFHVLQRAGVESLHIELTDHSGEYGAMILFQGPA